MCRKHHTALDITLQHRAVWSGTACSCMACRGMFMVAAVVMVVVMFVVMLRVTMTMMGPCIIVRCRTYLYRYWLDVWYTMGFCMTWYGVVWCGVVWSCMH